MSNESTKCFACESKVKYKSTYVGIFTVKMIRGNKGLYIYLLESHDGRHQLAFHDELTQYTDIETGDMISYLGHYYTVSHKLSDNNTIVLKEKNEIVNLKDVVLITRATRSELLNAIHNLYGGTIQNINSDSIKMGEIKELYGDLVFKKIISNRIR